MTQDDYLDLPMERAAAREDEFQAAVERYIEENRAELEAELAQRLGEDDLTVADMCEDMILERLWKLAVERVDRIMSEPEEKDDE